MPIFTGTGASDYLPGSDDDDTLRGLAGNDTLDASHGKDSLQGGSGSDVLYGDGGKDVLYGGSDMDFLYGGGSTDTLYGNGGDDYLSDDSGISYLDGGAGDDGLGVQGNTAATLIGGGGDDVLSVLAMADMTILADAGSGKDYISIGTMTGGTAQIDAGTGNDTVFIGALDGADMTLAGGDGTDFLFTAAASVLHFDIGETSHTYTSATGTTAVITGFETFEFLLGTGNDRIVLGAGDDVVWADAGANFVSMGQGKDEVSYDLGAANTLDGGDGHDLLDLTAGAQSVTFLVDTMTGDASDGLGSVLTGFETFRVTGGSVAGSYSLGTGDDSFYGGTADDTIWGQGGSDLLYGGALAYGGGGTDYMSSELIGARLYGGGGNDRMGTFTFHTDIAARLFGGEGDDFFDLAYGPTSLTGGAGADVFSWYFDTRHDDTITDFTSGEDQLQISNSATSGTAGPIRSSQFSLDAAVGAHGQFVLTYHKATDTSHLFWDPDGTGSAEAVNLMAFTGEVAMTFEDITLI